MKIKIVLGLVVGFFVVSGIVTFVSPEAQSVQDRQKVLLRQLEKDNGVIPLEIINPEVSFKEDPGKIGNINFVVRNNSNKNVVAFCLAYTVRTELNGSQSGQTFIHTVARLVDKDLMGLVGNAKPIIPGEEVPVTDTGETSYDNAAKVLGVDATLDYVEFDDGSSLGTNTKGGSLVGKIRNGYDRYKRAVFLKLSQSTDSEAAVEQILSGEMLNKLEFKSNEERSGAKLYRSQLIRIRDQDGAARIVNVVKKRPPSSIERSEQQ